MRLLAVLAVTTAGCLATPGPADPDAADAPVIDAPLDGPIDGVGCTDADLDGWYTCGRFVDCDDGDPGLHPGVFEPGTGVSRDCLPGTPAPLLRPLEIQTIGAGAEASYFVTAQTARYELQDTVAHQLGQIVVGGVPLLYGTADNGERHAGVHLWDQSFSIRATDDTLPTLPTLGRGVFRMRVTWSHNLLTNGSTTYTIVADGRIIRTDEMVVPQNGGSSITNYVALAAPLFTALRWQEPNPAIGPHDQTLVPPTSGSLSFLVGETGGATGFLCARDPGLREVGFAVVDPTPGRGLRATTGRTSTSSQLALQYDWAFTPFPGGRRVSHAMIWAGVGLADVCAETEVRARAFQTPARLTVDRGGNLGTDGSDFNSDGFIEDGGFWAIAATASAVDFHVTRGPGTVAGANNLFRITGLAEPHGTDPVVLRDDLPLVHGRDYFLDHDLAGNLWLYTMVQLGGATISLVGPRASCPACGT